MAHSGRRAARKALSILFLALLALSGTAPARVRAAEGEAPRSILWVGNSFFYYNNSMHNVLLGFVRAAGVRDARGVSVTISGSGLDWHDMESYFRPKAIGRYSFVGDNEIVFNKPGRMFDAVIMMDCSQCPVHPELSAAFHEFAERDARIVRAHEAEPILFMSWAYKNKPEMTQQLAEAYEQAARQSRMRVIPAGLAFARAVAARPQLELYQPDKRHPTLAGTYLAAATAFATLYGRTPVGSAFTAGLDAETAAFLQTVAAETAAAYKQP